MGEEQIEIWKERMKGMIEGELFQSSIGSNFKFPYSVSINQQLDIIVVSDYRSDRVQIFEIEGTFRCSFPVPSPKDVLIISSLKLLALTLSIEHTVRLYDLSSLLHEKDYGRIGTAYSSIGEEGKGPLQFNSPEGMAYSEEMQLLAVCDYSNNRIQMVEIENNEGERCARFHSSVTVSPLPEYIAFSDRSFFISNEEMVEMFSYSPPSSPPSSSSEEGDGGRWIVVRRFEVPNEPTPGFRGVGLGVAGRYVIASYEHQQWNIVIWKRSSGEVVCSINSSLHDGNHPSSSNLSLPYISPYAISCDDDIIALADTRLHRIVLFRIPL